MNFGKPSERQDGDRSYAPDGSKGANLRNVWTIATHSFKDAHFATFPPKLVEPCIKAGTSERGVCGECGAPWTRQVDTVKGGPVRTRNRREVYGREPETASWIPVRKYEHTTTGWAPTCDHNADPVPATVLDCFAGRWHGSGPRSRPSTTRLQC